MGELNMTDAISLETLTGWLQAYADQVREKAAWLTELDSAIGDADHGTNMERGTAALVEALEKSSPADAAALFKAVGMALVSKVGGASGSLYGTLFLDMAKNAPASATLTVEELATSLHAGIAGVIGRGRAEVGDKTMIDALQPAAEALTAALGAGTSAAGALAEAADAAERGRDATLPLVARKGRASYLGERSADHLDPGAASAALLVRTLASAVAAAE